MHAETLLLQLVSVLLVALAFGWILDRLHQPPVLGYILAGLFLGTIDSSSEQSRHAVSLLGEIGLVLLLFFIGSEVKIRELMKSWKISVLGTLLPMSATVMLCLAAGMVLGWNRSEAVFFGIIISLSSTAVVLKLLEEVDGLDSTVGRHSLGILLVQDFTLVPIMILLGLMGSDGGDWFTTLRQVLGAAVFCAVAVFLALRGGFRFPRWFSLEGRRDFQVLMGLIFCLGAALLGGLFGLSPALGAFLAGMVMGSSSEGQKIREGIESFKVLFVSLFFVSVGLLFDLDFVTANLFLILFLVFAVLVVNTVVNTFVLRLLGLDRTTSLILGCLLGQIGELSFLLAGTALSLQVIDSNAHRLTLSVIALTLLFTPFWMWAVRRLMYLRYGETGTIVFRAVEKV